MFCQQCGESVIDQSNYCSHCGQNLAPNLSHDETFIRPISALKRPIMCFGPKFKLLPLFLSILPIQIFMTIWSAGFFGGFSQAFIKQTGYFAEMPSYAPFIFFGTLAFLMVPFLVIIPAQRTYKETTYKIFNDRVEYMEGFWTLEKKVVYFTDIKEIYCRRGVFQKMYGLGTIVLSSPMTGSTMGVSRSGFKMRDVSNPDLLFKRLQGLIFEEHERAA